MEQLDLLPPETALNILRKLDAKDILSYCRLTKKYLYLCEDESLWHHLTTRDFGSFYQEYKSINEYNKFNRTNFKTWKDLYRFYETIKFNSKTLLDNFNSYDIVKYLIDEGTYSPISSVPVLEEAAKADILPVVELIISEMYAWEDLMDKAMIIASRYGYLDITKKFLKYFEPNDLLSLLEEAAAYGNLNIIKYIVENKRPRDDFLVKVGLVAAENGYLDIIKYLVEERKVSIHDDVLIRSSRNGHLNIVKYVIEKRKIDQEDISLAVNEAINNEHFNVVHYLSTHPEVNLEIDYAIFLGRASQFNKYRTTRYVLDNHKFTPQQLNESLSIASAHGHLNIVELLLDEGADDINLALRHAAEGGHLDLVKYLVERGAIDYQGAISAAEMPGYQDVIDYLNELIQK